MATRARDRAELVSRRVLPARELARLAPGWRLRGVRSTQDGPALDLLLTGPAGDLRLRLVPGAVPRALARTGLFSLVATGEGSGQDAPSDALAWLIARGEARLSADERVWIEGGYALHEGVLFARLTLACHERCRFCFASPDAAENTPDRVPDVARLERDLPALVRLGASHLVLTGGEPTLVPGLPALIAAARAAGVAIVELETTARRFAAPAFAARFADAPPQRALVSWYAATPQGSEALGGVRAGVDERVAGTEALLALGVVVTANVVLSRPTLAELPALADLLASRFGRRLQAISFSALAPFGRAWQEPGLVPAPTDVAAALGPVLTRLAAAGVRASIPAGCSLPACLLPDHLPVFLDAAASPTAGEGKSKPSSCRACRLDATCPGVWERYRERFGDEAWVPLRP